MAKSATPRRKGVAPRQQDPASSSQRSSAVAAFIAAHHAAIKQPSGEARFDIQVSAKPADWRYSATTATGKPFGFSPPHASMCKTDILIQACISPTFPNTNSAWWEALVRTKNTTIQLGLGAESAEPPAPADAAWIVHVASHTFKEGYCGIYQKRLLMTLGQHAVLTTLEAADPGAELIEHIRQLSITRLQGPSISDWEEAFKAIKTEPWINTFKPWNISAP